MTNIYSTLKHNHWYRNCIINSTMADKNKKVYFCPKCGPFIKVLKELWTSSSEGPYKIEFIHHINKNAEVVDEVEIKSRPEGEKVEYSYCGKCNQLIGKEENMKWTNDIIQMELNQ
jgi:hypothetical protein